MAGKNVNTSKNVLNGITVVQSMSLQRNIKFQSLMTILHRHSKTMFRVPSAFTCSLLVCLVQYLLVYNDKRCFETSFNTHLLELSVRDTEGSRNLARLCKKDGFTFLTILHYTIQNYLKACFWEFSSFRLQKWSQVKQIYK